MISLSLVLTLTLAVDDPRVDLVRLQLENRPAEARSLAAELLQERPDWAKTNGVDYLYAHLLDSEGQVQQAGDAFARVLSGSSPLEPFSRYRLALLQERLQHPEVAAGLVATLLEKGVPGSLVTRCVALLRRTLAQGGDCRLLTNLDPARFPTPDRRQLALAKALCDSKGADPEAGRRQLIDLLEEEIEDETAREAVEALDKGVQKSSTPASQLLVGLTFHQHREFPRAIRYIEGALRRMEQQGRRLPWSREMEARYAVARSHFWQQQYTEATKKFTALAEETQIPRERAKMLYQAGRSHELQGEWQEAANHFREAFNADATGGWAPAALISALRLEWRTGNEEAALGLFRLLQRKQQWRRNAAQAALFLASSDLVQGRGDRARAWLDFADGADRRRLWFEIYYWRGRLHEVEGAAGEALESYLRMLRRDRHHPLSQLAHGRLGRPSLAPLTRRTGLRLARSREIGDLHGAWLLLGDQDPTGIRSRLTLQQLFAADRQVAPFLSLDPTPVEGWPLWRTSLREPEEILLSVGVWREGASRMRRHFPVSDESLAVASSRILAGAEEHTHSLRIAQILQQRVPTGLPFDLLPDHFRRLLYPDAYGSLIRRQSTRFGVEPALLSAIIRQESHFNPNALSAASARGLSQFVMPTAESLAQDLGLGRLQPADLYKPPVSITLGAAYLDQLGELFGDLRPAVVAAYNAGEAQARLWQRHCFSQEPEEYISKVGFRQTSDYVEKVLRNYSHYQNIYGAELAP